MEFLVLFCFWWLCGIIGVSIWVFVSLSDSDSKIGWADSSFLLVLTAFGPLVLIIAALMWIEKQTGNTN